MPQAFLQSLQARPGDSQAFLMETSVSSMYTGKQETCFVFVFVFKDLSEHH